MRPTVNLQPKSRTDAILQNATLACGALRSVADSSQVPFLQSISAISFAILSGVQSVKMNREECIRLVERIEALIWAVVDVCVNSQTGNTLPPSILNNIGNFARTLQKILSFIEEQLKMGKLKRFFRQAENTQQLDECKAELKHALAIFSIQYGVTSAAALADLQIAENARRESLLELVAARATSTIGDNKFSSIKGDSTYWDSSSSLSSLLPPTPKIFHGRESELKDMVATFLRETARVAVLGAAGIGKTSLATALIHQQEIAEKYPRRYFVHCDAATTLIDLLTVIASHLELEPSRNIAKLIVRHLSAGLPALLVLDNLETPWEPINSRRDVEEFLALLTDVPHLALLVTMRGIERPAKVRWTRPFLPVLTPLTYDAARQTFLDIADDGHDDADVRELLRLTNHLPLAVNLIANVVSFEDTKSVLLRWKNENTTLLSEGHDKRSNLDMSIMLSLSSPRMLSVQGAQDLLSVMSLLPDGLSNSELVQSVLPIQDLQKARAALIRTSLAYLDRDDRLKVLVPIREYVRNMHPPSTSLVRPVRTYLYDVLMLWKSYRQISAPECVPRISANIGNFNSVLDWGLRVNDDDLPGTIRSILTLDSFSRAIGRGVTSLMSHLSDLTERCGDHQLKGEYISTLLESYEYQEIPDPHGLGVKAMEEFKLANDPIGEVQLYNVLGSYYLIQADEIGTALTYFNRALTLSIKIGDANGQTKALLHLAEVEFTRGDYRLGQKYAQQAQQSTKPNGHLMAEAHSIKIEVYCLTALGDFKRSVEVCARARELLTLCGMRGGSLDISLMNAEGDIHFAKSEFQQSRSFHLKILEKTSKDQSPLEYAYAQLNLAFVDSAIGAEEEKVYESLDAARAMFTSLHSLGGITFCDLIVADLQLRKGLTAEPRQIYERCFSSYRSRSDMAIMCLDKLSDPRYGLNDVPSTFTYAVVLFGFGRKSQNLVAIHTALRCLGDVFSVQGDEETAASLFAVALDGFTAMDVHRSRADCMVRLGEFARRQGDNAQAVSLWTEARPLYGKASQVTEVASIDERLTALEISAIPTEIVSNDLSTITNKAAQGLL
ncbi:hypothetical protein DFH09DRAFT_1172482 [Mycena vulgaris]|nr:hypothetical protein DFH09DRAFT_1172482 [Mycena vulgaris]